MKNEVIPFEGVSSAVVQWNDQRKEGFGNAAKINVYIQNEDGRILKSNVEVKPNNISNPTKYEFDFGGVSTGIIIIS
jgi:hypothetical protein